MMERFEYNRLLCAYIHLKINSTISFSGVFEN